MPYILSLASYHGAEVGFVLCNDERPSAYISIPHSCCLSWAIVAITALSRGCIFQAQWTRALTCISKQSACNAFAPPSQRSSDAARPPLHHSTKEDHWNDPGKTCRKPSTTLLRSARFSSILLIFPIASRCSRMTPHYLVCLIRCIATTTGSIATTISAARWVPARWTVSTAPTRCTTTEATSATATATSHAGHICAFRNNLPRVSMHHSLA